eukprot:gene10728-biopygen12651
MELREIRAGDYPVRWCNAWMMLLLLHSNAASASARLTLSVAAPPSTAKAGIADVAPKVQGTLILKVQFPGMTQPVAYGQHLRLSTIDKQPSITFNGTADVHYTVILVDPDAPVPWNPVAGQFVHLWAVNIPGTGRQQQLTNAAKGNIIAPYMPPNPPGGTHRYIAMVFEQPSGLKLPNSTLTSVDQRVGFNTTKWAQHHLKIAVPAAAILFTATAGQ